MGKESKMASQMSDSVVFRMMIVIGRAASGHLGEKDIGRQLTRHHVDLASAFDLVALCQSSVSDIFAIACQYLSELASRPDLGTVEVEDVDCRT